LETFKKSKQGDNMSNFSEFRKNYCKPFDEWMKIKGIEKDMFTNDNMKVFVLFDLYQKFQDETKNMQNINNVLSNIQTGELKKYIEERDKKDIKIVDNKGK